MTADVPATFNFLCRRVLSFRFITSIVAGNCLILFTTQNVYEEQETGNRDQNQMWPKYYMKNLKPWGLDRTFVAHKLWQSSCMGENASWEIASRCGFSIPFMYAALWLLLSHKSLPCTRQVQLPPFTHPSKPCSSIFYHVHVHLARDLSLTASRIFHLVTYLRHAT